MSYYNDVLAVCEKYLTSGAKRFLDRQITGHLDKEPGSITPIDKHELAKWAKISGTLLLGPVKADQLASDILSA
jgi:hypothetical protein